MAPFVPTSISLSLTWYEIVFPIVSEYLLQANNSRAVTELGCDKKVF